MRSNPTSGTFMDAQGRAPEPEPAVDPTPAVDPAPEEPVTTREWLWGAIVVVGVTVLGVAGTVWVLANMVFGCCGTRPAPGF